METGAAITRVTEQQDMASEAQNIAADAMWSGDDTGDILDKANDTFLTSTTDFLSGLSAIGVDGAG